MRVSFKLFPKYFSLHLIHILYSSAHRCM